MKSNVCVWWGWLLLSVCVQHCAHTRIAMRVLVPVRARANDMHYIHCKHTANTLHMNDIHHLH